MDAAAKPTRILVVANRTAATPRLLDEVSRRAQAGRCAFALLVPGVRDRKNWTPEVALSLLERAADDRAECAPRGSGGFASVRNAVREGDYDEIILSFRPAALSTWLRRDLLHRTKRLGLPVTPIVPTRRHVTNREAADMMVNGDFRVFDR